MYLIVVGAGLIGESLVEMALKDGHEVVLIEKNEARAKEASNRFEAVVLCADIGQGGILDEAGVARADALVATTADDAANLMAMFLGVEHGVRVRVSIVNDSSHQPLFKRLGVHVLLDPELVVARHLYGILTQPKLEDVATLEEEEQVFGVQLAPLSPLVGQSLAAILKARLLPDGVTIVARKRGAERQLAGAETDLLAGDHLTVYAQRPVNPGALKVFTGEEPA